MYLLYFNHKRRREIEKKEVSNTQTGRIFVVPRELGGGDENPTSLRREGGKEGNRDSANEKPCQLRQALDTTSGFSLVEWKNQSRREKSPRRLSTKDPH
jgi:hypothetical protein